MSRKNFDQLAAPDCFPREGFSASEFMIVKLRPTLRRVNSHYLTCSLQNLNWKQEFRILLLLHFCRAKQRKLLTKIRNSFLFRLVMNINELLLSGWIFRLPSLEPNDCSMRRSSDTSGMSLFCSNRFVGSSSGKDSSIDWMSVVVANKSITNWKKWEI